MVQRAGSIGSRRRWSAARNSGNGSLVAGKGVVAVQHTQSSLDVHSCAVTPGRFMNLLLDFSDPSSQRSRKECYFLHVPTAIADKQDLLNSIAKAGRFPGYFGHNWDSLSECLLDFDWIPQRQIVILHKDLPLHASPIDCRVYLEILVESVGDWTGAARQSNDSMVSPASDHELLVVFPQSQRDAIIKLLSV